MNIFQYLGLPEAHRKLSNKVTQFVKHWDEVVEKNKVGKEYIVQTKRDGVCALTVIHNGRVEIFSRTGKPFTTVGAIKMRITDLNLPDGVYMGELWVPKDVCSLEQLSGLVNPNRVNPIKIKDRDIPSQMRMSFFDLVDIKSFKLGASSRPFHYRSAALRVAVDTATWEHPAYGIDVLQNRRVLTVKDIDTHLDYLIKNGEEGLVIRDVNADWEAGHKGWRVMKKVRGIDYDLECIGYEVGTGKYSDKVANLIFKWRGPHSIKCMLGRGWTHAMAKNMLDIIRINEITFGDLGADSPIGKIFQVYALEESSQGKLRLPKVGEQRFDKDFPDQL